MKPPGEDEVGDLGFVLDASEADLACLLSGGSFSADSDLDALLEPDAAVQEVASRIAGQYAEVLVSTVQLLFRQHLEAVNLDAVAQLRRLAEGVGNHTQVALLDELVEGASGVLHASSAHRRQLALNRLRGWIPRFADTLEPADREHLLAVVSWESGTLPLLDELGTIRGIGPKRLGRLYSAGLHSVATVANADPVEVALVTGLSQALSVEVVGAARRFAKSERTRCATELRDRARRLSRVLRGIDLEVDPSILDLARSAMSELEELIAGLEESE